MSRDEADGPHPALTCPPSIGGQVCSDGCQWLCARTLTLSGIKQSFGATTWRATRASLRSNVVVDDPRLRSTPSLRFQLVDRLLFAQEGRAVAELGSCRHRRRKIFDELILPLHEPCAQLFHVRLPCV